MSSNYLLRFGAYNFPIGFTPLGAGGSLGLSVQARARGAGSVTSEARDEARTLVVRGGFRGETVDAWLAQKDAILTACGGAQNLWYGRDDRYYKAAQLESWSFTEPTGEGRLWGVLGFLSLTFLAARYPTEFAAGNPYTLESLGPAATLFLNVGYGPGGTQKGDSETLPVWTVVIAAAGTGPLQLNDAAGKQICLLYGQGTGGAFAAGDTIVLDADAANDGGQARYGKLNNARVPGLYDRKIPRIRAPRGSDPGTLGFQVQSLGTATLARFAVAFPGRWR